jgi:DNA-binding transcriptional LysR family regulator
MIRTNLDMDALRTLVTGFELGSFARAADRLGRSQSAISAQLRKLEDQAGQPLVQKSGRGLALTTAGETLLSYARRILELNDEGIDALRGGAVEGSVRLGLPQDFTEAWLPNVLGRFARAHPRVRIEVRTERNADLIQRTIRGELDLALAWGEKSGSPHAEPVAELPVAWIGRLDWGGITGLGVEPLPLVAFEQPCVFRTAAIAALDKAGIPWRLAFTSASLAGLWAAAAAGLGITVRTVIGMPRSLAALDPAASGLPALSRTALSLHRAEDQPGDAVKRLADILRETIQEEIGFQAAA